MIQVRRRIQTSNLRWLDSILWRGGGGYVQSSRIYHVGITLVASIMAKFKQILCQRFGNILKRSFKGPKNSE